MSGSAHVAHLRLVPTRAFLNRQTTSRFHNGRKLAVGQTSDGLCRMYADPNRIHALSFVPSRLSARCAGGRIRIPIWGSKMQRTEESPQERLERQEREREQMRQAIAAYAGPVTKCPPGRTSDPQVRARRRSHAQERIRNADGR